MNNLEKSLVYSLLAKGFASQLGRLKQVAKIDPDLAGTMVTGMVIAMARELPIEEMKKANAPCGDPSCNCHILGASVMEALTVLAALKV